ncbi:hypothetical protein [Deinococcus arenicola]|uniref:Uncharacterized protein n=1 Tax=Deinococcus arenicola TaxID=2994950 RepID=A0ABU4DRL5_9DEIO|nr:hypothetical protein [Deinococcus sp. ZS9-10]MDV6375075.1 hypothetical protein [Deinococcus sp. ZS9-10]
MTRPDDALRALERSLEDFELDSRWRGLHLVEFDLRGDLNPSRMLNSLFFDGGQLPGFADFCDAYVAQHFQAVGAMYWRLLELDPVKDAQTRERMMGRYAYQRFSDYLTANATDADLEQSLRARLYRTLAGIYTEYHAYFMTLNLLDPQRVSRSIEADQKGIDFTVSLHARVFNIHVSIDSESAFSALRAKIQTKRVAEADGVHVILPYGIHGRLPESTRKVGRGFHIFRESYIMGLIVAMQYYSGPDTVLLYQPASLSPFSSEEV